MKPKTLVLLAAIMPFVMHPTPNAWGETATTPAANTPAVPGHPLADLAAAQTVSRFTPQFGSEEQASAALSTDAAAPGVVVTLQPGKAGFPGMDLKPEGAAWDLSAYGHIEARIVNTGAKPLGLTMRVDNKGDWHDGPWNTEMTNIKPGAKATIKVVFGYSFGKKAYALKPAEIVSVLFFCNKSNEVQSFRIESVEAGGSPGEKPPVDPKSVRIKPKNGIILGSGVTIDPATQIEAKGTAKAEVSGSGLKIAFPATKGEQTVLLKTAQGRWDLTHAAEVRVKVKNIGSTPVTPTIQLNSNGGSTDPVSASAPIAPGGEQEIAVPFAASVPARGYYPAKLYAPCVEKGTGTTFASDATGPIKITASHEGEASLLVESIIADTPVAQLPAWLGKRPPVEGDWVKTLDDEFDGNAINEKIWSIYGVNYWDKKTHWSKDNLILGGGVVKQHFEKKRGYQNDDPNQMLGLTNPKTSESDYACGFLETYGKWVQRYGYFEARLKLPDAPGLWPTFWLMPDRGAEAGPQWKRQSTGDGAMEMDIMEHLTRWGPYRYNTANHWDGYGKEHMSNGSTCNYVLPDKDGFITCGLLWTPGVVVYYCNGKELFRFENPRISNVPSSIIFETTTGGWDNNAVDDATLPVDYVIDYVRVWQRKDLASPADGQKSPSAPAAK